MGQGIEAIRPCLTSTTMTRPGEQSMSYRRYVARVEKGRDLLRGELEQANQLRRDAHLPTYDINQVISEQEPLLNQDAWNQIEQERKAFAHFRRQQLAQLNPLCRAKTADWEEERAGGLRQAFVEHQIRTAWGAHRTLTCSPL